MPIYEYRCADGHTFEVIQRFSDDPISECETCAKPVEKVMHPVAVHFKGKGFYNTDYGTKKRAREAKESSESKSTTSSDGSSSEKSTSDKSSSDKSSSSTSSSSSSDSSSSSSSKGESKASSSSSKSSD